MRTWAATPDTVWMNGVATTGAICITHTKLVRAQSPPRCDHEGGRTIPLEAVGDGTEGQHLWLPDRVASVRARILSHERGLGSTHVW
jgi:hypothetical protein